VIKGFSDERYAGMVKDKDGNYNKCKANTFFFIQYQFQALLIIPCASTLYWVFRNYEASEDTTPRWTFIVGTCISIFGIIMEWVSDNQIQVYKDKKA